MTTIFGREEMPDTNNLSAELDGFQVIARRGVYGCWCGYIAVTTDHPWYGVEYPSIDAHGGCTYSGNTRPGTDVESRGLWWVGFDCAHSFDAPPPWAKDAQGSAWARGGFYRTLSYVEAELLRLVKEAAEQQGAQHGDD